MKEFQLYDEIDGKQHSGMAIYVRMKIFATPA
jgi:hypothetical protein